MTNTRPVNSPRPSLVIRVHLTDGSVDSYAQNDETEAKKLWDKIEASRVFLPQRIVLAGEHFKSVYVACQIVRVDFEMDSNECWEFPAGYSDIVELSETDFRKHARLDHPDLMARREEPTPVGDPLVSFIKLQMKGGRPVFLMVEAPVKPPVEVHSFMQFFLSKGSFHMRLCCGGIGVVNLEHLLGYTVYPGVAQVPADSWTVEPWPNPEPAPL